MTAGAGAFSRCPPGRRPLQSLTRHPGAPGGRGPPGSPPGRPRSPDTEVTPMSGRDRPDPTPTGADPAGQPPGGGRTVLWLPAGDEGEFRYWERVSATAPEGPAAGAGVRVTPAASVRV